MAPDSRTSRFVQIPKSWNAATIAIFSNVSGLSGADVWHRFATRYA